MQAVSSEMKNLNHKKAQAKKSHRGKEKATVASYQERCTQKLEDLKAQMEEIGNKKDKEWQKLRK